MEANQPKKFNYVDTTATRQVFKLHKRIRAVAGGTSASKTVSILVWLIDYCQSEKSNNKLATVVSESYPHLEKGAMLDFENIMKDRGYWDDTRWNATKHTYTFERGNKLEFFSVDTYGKAHGPRRDVLFLNECNHLIFTIVDQLITRTREIIWMDWNPTSEFWFYTDMQHQRDDIDFITLTYKDNEALDRTTIHEIELHKHNKNWWKVYGEGQLGEIEARIYTGWRVIDAVPEAAKFECGWLDFGYSNDPTAAGAIYYLDGWYILDELLYQTGLVNKNIADTLKPQLPKDHFLVADSAEPKSIAELLQWGLSCVASVKGKDSVNNGIQVIQGQKIAVTKRSLNLLKEYRNYLWVTDRNGKITNVPTPIWNHHMDGIRYAFSFLEPYVSVKEIGATHSPQAQKKIPVFFEENGISIGDAFADAEEIPGRVSPRSYQ